MSTPVPPEVPPTVGPYTVRSVLTATEAGHLASANDAQGRLLDVVLLGGGAGEDPAARDRFVAAAEAMHLADPDSVLDASPYGARASVAAPESATRSPTSSRRARSASTTGCGTRPPAHHHAYGTTGTDR